MQLSFFRLLFWLLICLPGISYAQVNMNELFTPTNKDQVKRNPLRVFMNHFTLNASTGYHYTNYQADLSNFDLLVADGEFFLAQFPEQVANRTPYNLFFDLMNRPQAFSDTFFIANGFGYVNGLETPFELQAQAYGIPINLGLQYNVYRFRIGVGASFEWHRMQKSVYRFGNNVEVPFSTDFKNSLFQRYYGHLSYRIRDYWDYSFLADIQVGVIRRGGNFNGNLSQNPVTVNVGAPIEYNFSEYFRLMVRPFAEFKSYNSLFPEINTTVKINNPTFGLQVGVSYNLPEVKRCPINPCHIQMKHVHQGREYRAQPITKKQNPKIGENHPKLLKYKGRNKRILNPY